MDPTTLGIIGTAVFLVLIFLGMNIGLSMLLVGAGGYLLMLDNFRGALSMIQSTVAEQATTYTLMVIPLFIAMGNFAFHAGLSGALFDFASKWLSRIPGSLAAAAVAASAGFGAICGSCAATCATMGAISLPEMRKHKYADPISTGAIAMGGTLGIMIPPSTPMIIYCVMAEENIVKMFSAGILPGILLTILCIITIFIIVKTSKKGSVPDTYKVKWVDRFKAFKGLIPVVILFGVVLGGLFTGYFPATQASAVGALLAFLILAFSKGFTWAKARDAIKDTVTTFSMTFLILIGATVFSKFLAMSGIPHLLAQKIGEAEMPFWLVLIIMTVVYIILGMLMDELPMILLTVPVFLPIMHTYGIENIWFGIYIILVMELGAIAPPVGLNCFIIQGIAKDIPLYTIYRGALPYVITILVAVVIIYIFPEIVMVIPNAL